MPKEKTMHKLPRLRQLRRRAGYTVRSLAQAAGVDKDTVSRIERGHPARLSTIEALARALGVTEKDVMGWPGWPEEQVSAYLDSLQWEQKTLFDAETDRMSDAELAMFVRTDPVLKRIAGAIHLADQERRKVEKFLHRKAG